MTNVSTKSGFTIVELMVTLAVAAILIGFAVPAFNDFIVQRTMASRVNDFVMAVTYARSEAVRRGDVVSVQAEGGDADNEWGGGYCVVVGDPGNCNDPDTVLRSFADMDPAEVTFDAFDGLHGEDTLRFNSRGMLIGLASGRVDLCHAERDPGRRVVISPTGRADAQELECNG